MLLRPRKIRVEPNYRDNSEDEEDSVESDQEIIKASPGKVKPISKCGNEDSITGNGEPRRKRGRPRKCPVDETQIEIKIENDLEEGGGETVTEEIPQACSTVDDVEDIIVTPDVMLAYAPSTQNSESPNGSCDYSEEDDNDDFSASLAASHVSSMCISEPFLSATKPKKIYTPPPYNTMKGLEYCCPYCVMSTPNHREFRSHCYYAPFNRISVYYKAIEFTARRWCSECTNSFFTFRMYALHPHGTYGLDNNQCAVCQSNFRYHCELLKHQISFKHNPDVYRCVYCDVRFCTVLSLEEHCLVKHPKKDFIVTCQICQKRVESDMLLDYTRHLSLNNTHVWFKQPVENKQSRWKFAYSVFVPMQNLMCGRAPKTDKQVWIGDQLSVTRYVCCVCTTVYSAVSLLQAHFQVRHMSAVLKGTLTVVAPQPPPKTTQDPSSTLLEPVCELSEGLSDDAPQFSHPNPTGTRKTIILHNIPIGGAPTIKTPQEVVTNQDGNPLRLKIVDVRSENVEEAAEVEASSTSQAGFATTTPVPVQNVASELQTPSNLQPNLVPNLRASTPSNVSSPNLPVVSSRNVTEQFKMVPLKSMNGETISQIILRKVTNLQNTSATTASSITTGGAGVIGEPSEPQFSQVLVAIKSTTDLSANKSTTMTQQQQENNIQDVDMKRAVVKLERLESQIGEEKYQEMIYDYDHLQIKHEPQSPEMSGHGHDDDFETREKNKSDKMKQSCVDVGDRVYSESSQKSINNDDDDELGYHHQHEQQSGLKMLVKRSQNGEYSSELCDHRAKSVSSEFKNCEIMLSAEHLRNLHAIKLQLSDKKEENNSEFDDWEVCRRKSEENSDGGAESGVEQVQSQNESSEGSDHKMVAGSSSIATVTAESVTIKSESTSSGQSGVAESCSIASESSSGGQQDWGRRRDDLRPTVSGKRKKGQQEEDCCEAPSKKMCVEPETQNEVAVNNMIVKNCAQKHSDVSENTNISGDSAAKKITVVAIEKLLPKSSPPPSPPVALSADRCVLKAGDTTMTQEPNKSGENVDLTGVKSAFPQADSSTMHEQASHCAKKVVEDPLGGGVVVANRQPKHHKNDDCRRQIVLVKTTGPRKPPPPDVSKGSDPAVTKDVPASKPPSPLLLTSSVNGASKQTLVIRNQKLLIANVKRDPASSAPFKGTAFVCPFCSRVFQDGDVFRRHMCLSARDNVSYYNREIELSILKVALARNPPYLTPLGNCRRSGRCPVCAFRSEAHCEYASHLVSAKHNPDIVRCSRESCRGVVFPTESMFQDHNLRWHKGGAKLQCQMCHKQFTTLIAFAKHCQAKHVVKCLPLQCQYCYSQFSRKAELNAHLRGVNRVFKQTVCQPDGNEIEPIPGTTHKCKKCNKFFYSQASLACHKFTTHPDNSSPTSRCLFCEHVYSEKFFLHQHLAACHTSKDVSNSGAPQEKREEASSRAVTIAACHSSNDRSGPPIEKSEDETSQTPTEDDDSPSQGSSVVTIKYEGDGVHTIHHSVNCDQLDEISEESESDDD